MDSKIKNELEGLADHIDERLENLAAIYQRPMLPAAIGALIAVDSAFSAFVQLMKGIAGADDEDAKVEMIMTGGEIACNCMVSAINNVVSVLDVENSPALIKDAVAILKMRHDLEDKIIAEGVGDE